MTRLLALLLMLIVATPALAAGGGTPAVGGSRLVKHFDFDERPLGNLEETPMRWAKVVGNGYPHWVRGGLRETSGKDGGWGFTLALDGGNVAYRLAPGTVPARPGASYRIEVHCRTDELQHARARLAAHVADADGNPIPGTTVYGQPHAGDWGVMEVELTVPEGVTDVSLCVELGLLQPEKLSGGVEAWQELPGNLGRVMLRDVTGSATFDDLSIIRVPDVTLDTDHLANVYPADAVLAVGVRVDDEQTNDLTGLLRVTDARGDEVMRRSGPMRSLIGTLPGGRVPIGRLLPGWYRAELSVYTDDEAVPHLVERALDVVVLSEEQWRVRPDGRFGLDATHVPAGRWGGLAGLFRELGAGRALVPVWGIGGFGDTSGFEATVEDLHRHGVRASAALVASPQGMIWDAAEPGPWREEVNRIAARHGGHLGAWQLGDAQAARMWATSLTPDLRVNQLRDTLRPLTGKPDVALPWPAYHELPAGAGQVALQVPAEILPDQLPVYLDDFKARGLASPAVRLDTLGADGYGELRQWRDLALRVGYALAADVKRIDLPAPVVVGADGQLTPQRLLLPMRTLLKTLAGSQCFGEVPIGGGLGGGVRGLIFERPKPGGRTGERDGVLMIWSDVGKVPVEVDVTVGGEPTMIRLDGTTKPLAAIGGRVNVTAGPMPVLIVGGDVEMARLRASVTIDRPTIESEFANHQRVVSLTNTYPFHLLADVAIDAPRGWNVELQDRRLSLAPGETARLPVTIRFPYNATTGAHRLTVRVMPDDGNDTDAPLDIRLGEGEVTLSTLALVEGGDVIVQQLVTNYSDEPVRYNGFVHLPGMPRQERLLVDLQPGGTAVKKYAFAGGAAFLPATIRSGLIEIDGDKVLNETLGVE